MIFSVIGILLLAYSYHHFKRGFLYYMLFEVVFFPNAKIFTLAGVPSVPISLVMSFGFFLLYHFRYKNKSSALICNLKFPFIVPIFLYAVSRFVTCFSSLGGFADEFPRFIGFLFSSCLEIWLIWKVIETKKDFMFLLNGLTIIFAFAGIYGVISYFLQSNVVFEYKSSLIDNGLVAYLGADDRGYRLTSIFEHSLGAGMNHGMYIILISIALFCLKDKIKYKQLVFVAITCGVVCIFYTKMRSGLFFTMLGMVAVFNMKKKQTYKFFVVFVVMMLLLLPLFQEQLDIFFSLFDSTRQDKVGGSDSKMRLEQLAASAFYMKQSPIGGMGEQCLSYLSIGARAKLRGLESVYFEEMVRHGIVGLVAAISMMYYSLIKVPKKFHSRELFFVSLAFWATYSLTSIPCFRMHLYYISLFYIIKNTETYKNSRWFQYEIS